MGRRVGRHFDGHGDKLFEGTVRCRWDSDDGPIWEVKYDDDGDEESYDMEELNAILVEPAIWVSPFWGDERVRFTVEAEGDGRWCNCTGKKKFYEQWPGHESTKTHLRNFFGETEADGSATLRFTGTVPTEDLEAFAKWTGSGVGDNTLKSYARDAERLFSEPEKFGLPNGCTLDEACANLRERSDEIDPKKYLVAALRKLSQFLARDV